MSEGEVVLEAKDLSKAFPVRGAGLLRRQAASLVALDGVSFALHHGEALGVVGESGCGKSTLAKVLLGLVRPSAGSVLYRGRDLVTMRPAEVREVRRHVQIVLQDPYSSLDPRMTIGEAIAEPLQIHDGLCPRSQRRQRVRELLEMVGLSGDFANRYPHQFSGGQRQRAVIARALAVRPEVIVCDEPLSSLDVSAQAQILALLRSLQGELNLTFVFIAHDLSVVRYISDRIAVMYLGRVVEIGGKEELCGHPSHPYTQALFSAAPVPDPEAQRSRRRIMLEGDVPSPLERPSGCRFRTRCWKAQQICRSEEPSLAGVPGTSLEAACHFPAPEPAVASPAPAGGWAGQTPIALSG